MITNCRLYGNISQTLLLYKREGFTTNWTLQNHRGCYWCVKIPQYGYMDHGSKHITFHFKNHLAFLAMCYWPPLVCDKLLRAPATVKLVYSIQISKSLLRKFSTIPFFREMKIIYIVYIFRLFYVCINNECVRFLNTVYRQALYQWWIWQRQRVSLGSVTMDLFFIVNYVLVMDSL